MTQNNFKNILPHYENITKNYEHIIKTLSSVQQLDELVSPVLKQDILFATNNVVNSTYSIYAYPNLLEPIIRNQRMIQNITRHLSIVVERENQILHTFNSLNYAHIKKDIFNINNPLATIMEQTINNISRSEISLLAQPISIINSIYAQTQIIQNITDIYNIVPQMLPFLDISVLNSYIQDICINIPNDVLIDFNKTELNIIDKIQPLIEAFNKNIYTKIKIKILDNKEKINSLIIFIIIAIVLHYLGYDFEEHLLSIINGFISSALYDHVKKILNNPK